MDGRGIGDAIAGAMIAVALIGFAAGAFVFLGIPKIWELIKPWIHTITS